MAGKIDKLKRLASAMENEASDMEGTAGELNKGANILKKGIGVLEYWNPNDGSKREEARKEILRLEKKISGTYKKYILLWCIMIIATVIICIRFV